MSGHEQLQMLTIDGRPIDKSKYEGFMGKSISIDNFERLNRLGEGTYGVVYRARDKRNDSIVALKLMRTRSHGDGIPLTALREITLLRSLRHRNVLKVLDVAVDLYKLDEVYMILEYAEQDMAYLIDHGYAKFTASEVKCIFMQFFEGLEYIHGQGIIHRDIKMSNILLSAKGIVKIADFGLARSHIDRPMSPNVVTIWYRSPELLFGSPRYTQAVDMWASGCVVGELVLLTPLLPGNSEEQQVDLIVDLLGTPTERIWPGFRTLPLIRHYRIPDSQPSTLSKVLRGQTAAMLEMVNKLLTYDPEMRISAENALQLPYFTREEPAPQDPSLLPTFPELRNKIHSKREKESKYETDTTELIDAATKHESSRKKRKL
ncbi:kinase-like domain-containing protein [Dipodascopsis uninucleata]